MRKKILFSFLTAVVGGIVFFSGFHYGTSNEQKKLRVGSNRIVKTERGILVAGGVLRGWEVRDFTNAEKVSDLVFKKFSVAYNTNPDSFHFGHYTVSYGYMENNSGFEPIIVFLAPPADYKGCNGADECAEAAKKEVIVTLATVPRLDFCPVPPLTYSETEDKFIDQTAQEAVRAIVKYDQTTPSSN